MRTAYMVSLILGVGLTLIYLLQENYASFMYLFSSALPLFTVGAAMVTAMFALKKYWGPPRDKFFRIWLGFTLGMGFLFVGQVLWIAYTLLLNVEAPFPSIADVVWLIGAVPPFIALYLYVATFRFVIPKLMHTTADVVVSIGSLATFIALVAVILVEVAEAEMTTLIVYTENIALDLALFSLSIIGLLIFVKGRIARAWFLVNFALLMITLGDLLFIYTTLKDTYYIGHPLELFYHWGLISFALAFYTHMKEL